MRIDFPVRNRDCDSTSVATRNGGPNLARRGITTTPSHPGNGGIEPALEAAWESQKQQAEAVVAKAVDLLRARGLTVTGAVEQGEPKSKILDVA